MDFIEGVSLREVMTSVRNGKLKELKEKYPYLPDLAEVGKRIYEISMRSIFELGVFHADPHPGNLFVMEDGDIGFVDFGIVGTLSSRMREKNFRYIDALSAGKMMKLPKSIPLSSSHIETRI